jgi:hypothetical protein
MWKQKNNDEGKKEQNKEFVKKAGTYTFSNPVIFLSHHRLVRKIQDTPFSTLEFCPFHSPLIISTVHFPSVGHICHHCPLHKGR